MAWLRDDVQTADVETAEVIGPVKGRLLAWVAVCLVALGFPLLRPGFEVQIYAQAAIYAIIGLSLNVLLGYVGQLSLGHQAFVGVGAFSVAYLVTKQGLPFPVALAGAVLVGAAQAAVLGLVALRLRGLYFALVTLSYGLVAEQSIFRVQALTGGTAGQEAPKPAGFATDHRYYYLCLALLALVVWLDARLVRSKGGRVLFAIRSNPRLAAAFGADTRRATLFAFGVSGALAGLGGALLAANNTFVSSETFNFQLALLFVIMTVVGGVGSPLGVAVGSAFFALAGHFFDRLGAERLVNFAPGLPDLTPEMAALLLGPVLLLVNLVHDPGGIGARLAPVGRWMTHRGGHAGEVPSAPLAEVAGARGS